MGRSLVAARVDANAAPTKKQKTVVALGVPANQDVGATAAASSAMMPTLVPFFSSNKSKLAQRVKTVVQLEIVDLQADPKKKKQPRIEHVVLSGASDMKKVHQLVAYLIGETNVYEYHSQRGKSAQGCRFELSIPHHKPCWIAPPVEGKKAAKSGADAVVDKSLKLVQVFQGLNCSANGGIVYDSDLARTIATTPHALIFVSPTKGRFAIHVKAIAPKQVDFFKAALLPRIVAYDDKNKSGFGFSYSQAKRMMAGDRQDSKVTMLGVPSTASRDQVQLDRWKKPLCEPDGSQVCVHSVLGFSLWKKAEMVRSAGPPDAARI